MIIQDPVTGADIEVITLEESTAKLEAEKAAAAEAVKAELEAKHKAELEAKDAHHKTKLDEFVQAKKGVAEKEDELKAQMEETKRIAEEAKTSVEQAKADKAKTVKDYWIKSTVGTDPELVKKMEEHYDMVNLEVKDDADIQRRVSLAANMIGIHDIVAPNVPFNDGMPPNFAPKDGVSAQDHAEWKKNLNL